MAEDLPSSAESKRSFGQRLRKEREARGIELSAISASTKIRESYLRALEDDQFEDLPGKLYNRGYVRACAEFIGVDADEMVAAYEAEVSAQARKRDASLLEEAERNARLLEPLRPPAPAPRGGRGLIATVAVAAIAGAALGFAWWYLHVGGVSAPAAEAVASQNAGTMEATGAEPAETPAEQDEQAAPPGRQETAAPTAATPAAVGEQAEEPPRGESPGASAPASAQPSTPPVKEAGASKADRRAASTEAKTAPASPPVARPEPVKPQVEPQTRPAATMPSPPPSRPQPLEKSEVGGASPAAPPSAPASSSLSVAEFGTGTALVDHRLAGAGTDFREGDRVWFWTRVTGGRPGDVIRHMWFKRGSLVSVIEITLGGPNWRGASYQTMRKGSAGLWKVEARGADDRTLAEVTFTCRPGASAAEAAERAGKRSDPTAPAGDPLSH